MKKEPYETQKDKKNALYINKDSGMWPYLVQINAPHYACMSVPAVEF